MKPRVRDGNPSKDLSSLDCPERKRSRQVEEFKVFLLRNDRKIRTVYRHLKNLERIQAYCPNLTKDEVEAYFTKLREQGCKNTYLNSMLHTARMYAHFKGTEELLTIKYRKREIFQKATLSDDEIETFLNLEFPRSTKPYYDRRTNAYHEPFLYKRWRVWNVFFSIMAFAGMRPGEVAALRVGDIDFGRQVFVIRDSKTNTPGVAPIAPNIIDLIKKHLEGLEGEYLFPSFEGGKAWKGKGMDGGEAILNSNAWHDHFHKRLKILGIKRTNLTAYSFRHSYATRLLESNVSLFHVKKLLRHNDLRSTLVYEHLTTKDLIDAVQKLPLVRRGTHPKMILQAIIELIKSFKIEDDTRFNYRIEENETSVRFEVHIKETNS